MGAGDRDRLLHPHQLGEHFGALDRGRRRSAAAWTSGLSSLIAVEQTTTAASPRLSGEWPIADGDAGLAQLLDDIGVGGVRALHLVAELVHHLGDARHADAADADEMDRADVGAQRLHHAGMPPAGTSARNARAQRGTDRDRRHPIADALDEVGEIARGVGPSDDKARPAALLSATGSIASASIWRASTSGVKLAWESRARRPP